MSCAFCWQFFCASLVVISSGCSQCLCHVLHGLRAKSFFYGKKKKHLIFIIMKKDFFFYGVLIWYKNIISKLFNNSSQIKPTGASIITWLMIPSSYLSVSCYLQLNFSQKVFLFRNWHFFYEKTHYYIHH